MSTWYAARVRCPSCEHEFEGRFVRGANAARTPELRDAAIAGTLNRPPCPACGKAHAASATLVYADPPRGHWISVALLDELARWGEIESAALVAFQTGLASTGANTPGAARVRIVFDLDELRERLVIWDAGLDDSVIECVKLLCLREQPDLRGPRERIRLMRVTPTATVFGVIEAAAPECCRAELDVERTVVDRVARDPVWRERFPALFAPGFVSIDRYLR